MNPRLNAIYTKPNAELSGYTMTAFFIQGQVTKVFLDSLNIESLWTKARDLTIPSYDKMSFEGYEIEYQSNVGHTAITIVKFNFISKTVKEKMELMVANAERIRGLYYEGKRV